MKRGIKCLELQGPEYWGDFGLVEDPPSPTLPSKRIKKEEPLDPPDNRINYHLAPEDKLMECPYQKSHLILEQRWFRHLCKCRSNYLKECHAKSLPVEMGICKWNNGHHYHFRHEEHHERFCPDRREDNEVTEIKVFEVSGPRPNVTNPVIETSDHDENQFADEKKPTVKPPYTRRPTAKLKVTETIKIEDTFWDDEPPAVTQNQPAYNPNHAILRKNVPFIKIPPGLAKKERGTFRVLQIARVQNGPVYIEEDENGQFSAVKPEPGLTRRKSF